jgi:hypothetical protein
MKRLYNKRKIDGTMGCLVGRVTAMSDPSARRKKRRPVAEQQVDTLARYTLRSDLGTAQPPAEVWTRLQARVEATPRPERIVAPPPPRWLLWWQSFLSAAPRLSARMSSMSAAALLLIMLAHSTLSTLNPDGTPLPTSAVRAPHDALTIVARRLDSVEVDTRLDDQAYEIQMTRPRPAYAPAPQDALLQPVYPAPDAAAADNNPLVMEPEDPTTLVPPQSLSVHTNPIIIAAPGDPNYRYVGTIAR